MTLTHTYTRTFDRFLLDGCLPERIIVREVTPEGHATRLYAVVADHGWAERILAGDCYRRDASDLAFAVSELLDIPIEEAPGDATPREANRQVESREGMVTVYDSDGKYVGCMGIETWQRLLDSEAANSHEVPR